MSANYFNPVHSVAGVGALASLADLTAGKRTVLVTFPEARELGLVARIEALLGRNLVQVIDRVLPNPDVAELRGMYEAFWREHEDTEVLLATGAGTLQTIVYGVLPQVVTAWIAVCLYRFETNLRQATVLGMVGAGGIGFELTGSMKLFQYQDTAMCILVIIAMVMAADFLSSRMRQWIQQGSR